MGTGCCRCPSDRSLSYRARVQTRVQSMSFCTTSIMTRCLCSATNVLGRYSFTANVPASGSLRPLRDPDAAGLDDDDGAAD